MARYASWASNEFSLIKEGSAAKILTLIRAYSYSDAVESALVYGAGRDPVGTTDPIYKPGDMSLEFLNKWWRTFIREVTNDGEVPLGELDFRLTVKRKSRTDTDSIVDEIDFQFLGGEDSGQQGSSDPLVTVVPCLPTKIKRNGVQL